MNTMLPERFWAKVRQQGECWQWTGAKQGGGYGYVTIRRKNYSAHRLTYESLRASIPEGLHLDHLCRNRACVNPWHLEPVTQRENLMRGISPSAINNRKTHCVNGHPYDESNTRRSPSSSRECRACDREKHDLERARKCAGPVPCEVDGCTRSFVSEHGRLIHQVRRHGGAS